MKTQITEIEFNALKALITKPSVHVFMIDQAVGTQFYAKGADSVWTIETDGVVTFWK